MSVRGAERSRFCSESLCKGNPCARFPAEEIADFGFFDRLPADATTKFFFKAKANALT
jgi:hypothetical protein